jgi:hypothetical protein
VTARYTAPESSQPKPSRRASAAATVDLLPAGPSMAMTGLGSR